MKGFSKTFHKIFTKKETQNKISHLFCVRAFPISFYKNIKPLLTADYRKLPFCPRGIHMS